jgi:hypothetical protein
VVISEIFEDGVSPRFRLHLETEPSLGAHSTVIKTMRPEGLSQQFSMEKPDSPALLKLACLQNLLFDSGISYLR